MINFEELNETTVVFSIGTKFKKDNILIDKEDQPIIERYPGKFFVKRIDGVRKVVSFTRGGYYIELPNILQKRYSQARVTYINNNPLDCRKKNLDFMLPEGIYNTTAQESDVDSMLELNYKIYPKQWHVSKSFVLNVLKKNPKVYNLIKTESGVKGISTFIPLEKEVYDQVMTGKLEEGELYNHVLPYDTEGDVYLYLISIIVDVTESECKRYSKPLILSIPEQLDTVDKSGGTIKEIGAVAISDDGHKILKRIGFAYSEDLIEGDHRYGVYKATYDSIRTSIIG